MEQSLMKTTLTLALALIAAVFAATAFAQKPDATGGAVVTSEPGKATAVRAVEVSAQVVGIDKATRTVTLKGPKGNVVDIVAGDEVKNFDQIKVGDFVVVRYAQALTLELRKTKVSAGEPTVREGAREAKPGERPGSRRRARGHRDRHGHRCRSEEEHDHAQGAAGQRRDARRAEPGSVQGGQERRPGRGDLHRSARALRRAGAEAGGQVIASCVDL